MVKMAGSFLNNVVVSLNVHKRPVEEYDSVPGSSGVEILS